MRKWEIRDIIYKVRERENNQVSILVLFFNKIHNPKKYRINSKHILTYCLNINHLDILISLNLIEEYTDHYK